MNKEDAIKKVLLQMFKTPQRVKIPDTELIVWTTEKMMQGTEKLPGKWILIAYRLPEEGPSHAA